jgi:uncharacterized phosphosugar-binding protein
MTPKQFYESTDRNKVRAVAEAAGTNLANFQQIALYGGSCSKDLAKRLYEASGGVMSRDEILFPELYDVSEAS